MLLFSFLYSSHFFIIMKRIITIILTLFLSITVFAQVDSTHIQHLDKIQEIQLIREQLNSLLIALPNSQNLYLDKELYKSLLKEYLKKEEEYYIFLLHDAITKRQINQIIQREYLEE